MEWYIWVLSGIIIGGILFNAKMRKGAMRMLSGLLGEKTKKEKSNMIVRLEGKEYRLVPKNEEED